MKKLIILLVLFWASAAHAEFTIGDLWDWGALRIENSTLSGVYAESREALADELRRAARTCGVAEHALVIELRGNLGNVSMTVDTPDDLPFESVPVECPDSRFTRCWFIKYGDEVKK